MFPPRTLDFLARQDIQVTADPGSCGGRLYDVIHKPWETQESRITSAPLEAAILQDVLGWSWLA